MGRPRLYANDAEKVAAHRAKHNTKTITIELPADLVEALNDYMQFKNTTKNEVFAKLIKNQLLRKR